MLKHSKLIDIELVFFLFFFLLTPLFKNIIIIEIELKLVSLRIIGHGERHNHPSSTKDTFIISVNGLFSAPEILAVSAALIPWFAPVIHRLIAICKQVNGVQLCSFSCPVITGFLWMKVWQTIFAKEWYVGSSWKQIS